MGTEANASDATLVARMARADRQALATLYQRYAPRLLLLAERMLGVRSEAEDLLQDVFIEAWRHAADYSAERGSVITWLSLRTRSRALDRRKAYPARKAVELSESLLAEIADPNGDLARRSDHGRLRQALQSMSHEEQQVILLGYFEGLSSSEIAARMKSPVGTVKSRTRSALTHLRDYFAEQERQP
ncbi:MAG TPA: sigma-70 family RNA polymerase sigma factor [Polyangiaceae bacterium]|nr:sigma-70 family RNA polymerase sigma factor [Polyangiaceae bacterium]